MTQQPARLASQQAQAAAPRQESDRDDIEIVDDDGAVNKILELEEIAELLRTSFQGRQPMP